MHKFAIVLGSLACAAHARRVLQEAAFNPSAIGARAPTASTRARGNNPTMVEAHDKYGAGGGKAYTCFPPIPAGEEKNIIDTLLDLDGPAIYEVDLETQETSFQGNDGMDLFMLELEDFGLDKVLMDESQEFTLMAPTNSVVEAYKAMGGEFTKEILEYHIVKGKKNYKLNGYTDDEEGLQPLSLTYETISGQPIIHKLADVGQWHEIGGVAMPGAGSWRGMEDTAHPYNVE
mmetsp:Transcript_37778/g.68800  ORF Transcript_37778/g.68800 Transcript_37778/m.68800 type:complete len:232 (-) Transcript_37778:23-718(-)